MFAMLLLMFALFLFPTLFFLASLFHVFFHLLVGTKMPAVVMVMVIPVGAVFTVPVIVDPLEPVAA